MTKFSTTQNNTPGPQDVLAFQDRSVPGINPNNATRSERQGVIGQAKKWSLPSKKKLLSVCSVLALTMGVGVSIQTLLSPSLMEQAEDQKAQDRIKAMKAEQQVLVKQQLAPSRYIGVVGVRHGLPKDLGQNDMMTDRVTFKGYRVGEAALVLDEWATRVVGHSFLTKENVISPQSHAIEKDPYSLVNDAPLVYRHEEGHAQMFDEHIKVKSPSTWKGELSQIIVQRLNQHDGLLGPGKTELAEMKKAGIATKTIPPLSAQDQQDLNNWRERWMASLRGEAFADAFAVLTQAHRGESVLKETALKIHSNRLVGTKPESGPQATGGAIFAAGSNHSVDMASFLAGQMSAQEVTKLSRMEVLELSGRIADASLAWSIARQGPLIGFFSNEGQAWAVKAAAKAGLSELEALKQWNGWKSDASSSLPEAAFGDFKWTVGGHDFNAKGLMKHDSPHIQWRFDGAAGVRGGKFIERGAGGPVAQQQMMDLEDKKADMFEVAGMLDARQDAVRLSKSAPLWSQWVMAKRLGTDPLQELVRLKRSFGEDHGNALFGYSDALYKGIESVMSLSGFEQDVSVQVKGPLNMKQRLMEHREQKRAQEPVGAKDRLSGKARL